MSLLPLLLKTAGLRHGGTKRKSSRSKRWSKSAQTIFASWAVVGQLGGMSLLVAEVMEPQLGKAEITAIPGSSGAGGGSAGTSSASSSFAIGVGATTGGTSHSYALGSSASAENNFAIALVRVLQLLVVPPRHPVIKPMHLVLTPRQWVLKLALLG